jgi:hypothetical protein
MMDTKIGKEMSAAGWYPHFPIVCIPGTLAGNHVPFHPEKTYSQISGFASSALYAQQGHKGWEGQRIWLDINNLLGGKVLLYRYFKYF